MKFGFIGAGSVAQTVSRHLLRFGHEVLVSNSRGPDTLEQLARQLGAGAFAGTPEQAAEQELVVLSVPWSGVPLALAAVRNWSGRTLIDATNRLDRANPLDRGDISGRTTSEIVRDLAPGARVVKAFNSVPMQWIADISPTRPKTVLFVSGDETEAKELLRLVLEQIGFACVDLGSLAAGGRLQQIGGPLAGLNLTLEDRLVL